MILLVIILSALFIYFIFFVSQFINIFLFGNAPFISTDRETIRRIISEVQIKDKSLIYELGCGRARFLRLVEKVSPSAELTGAENLFSLYLINKIRLELQASKIKLLKQDFFEINLASADLIYCYLNNATMEKLGEKFKQECRVGTQIVSRSFKIPQLEPFKLLKIKNKNIYFYKI
ncbi:MAG: hypothetical protein NTX66_02050 [Candidatus Falkowbacteria bacterium]|nr:hypothetical protein [Candidatus Falkowbacteria bacterium]